MIMHKCMVGWVIDTWFQFAKFAKNSNKIILPQNHKTHIAKTDTSESACLLDEVFKKAISFTQ